MNRTRTRRIVSSLACLLGLVLATAGCDLGAPRTETAQDSGPPIGDTACRLLGIQGGGGTICPGDRVTLVGNNFPDDVSLLRVAFSAGNSEADGVSISVRNRPQSAGSLTTSSTLVVLAPAGISAGVITLFCEGQFAGSVGFDSCPALYSATLGLSETQPFVAFIPGLGFQAQGSPIKVYGLNLSDVEEVFLDDGGSSAPIRIPASSFTRDQFGGITPGQVSSGYESLSFDLAAAPNNGRSLAFDQQRDNMGIVAQSSTGRSNRLEVPVVTDQSFNVAALGAVINGMRSPTGVLSGPVRFDYSCYEVAIDASWAMNLEWCVGDCDPVEPPTVGFTPGDPVSDRWFLAKPRDTDPAHEGRVGIMCGTLLHGANDGRLLPGRGALRTYVWDAQCDPVFAEMRSSGGPREFVVQFRLRPEPDRGTRNPVGHFYQAPSIVYLDLEDRTGEDTSASRRAEIVETFDSTVRFDRATTDTMNSSLLLDPVRWGPPQNPGFLEGPVEMSSPDPFGQGRGVMRFARQDTNGFPSPETIVDQFYLIDTSRMAISFNLVRNLGAGTPLVVDPLPYVLTDTGTPQGVPVANPGQARSEWQIARLEILPDTRVLVQGTNPLIIRCSGLAPPPASCPDCTVLIEGVLDLSGANGADGTLTGGRGGAGSAGGGNGGDGATVLLSAQPAITGFTPATRGGNDGGGRGDTPMATDPDPAANLSRLWGGPGGGGGHNGAGNAGDYGNVSISGFAAPQAGRGGPARGHFLQTPLTPGSGGGGGGGTITRIVTQQAPAPIFVATGGGGGGGGGGALRLTVEGDVVITGEVRASGGKGGTGTIPPADQNGFPPAASVPGAPGGGGSGGSIHMQATGTIEVADCGRLQVNGGPPGDADRRQAGLNSLPGSGFGAPGFVRLESEIGATPICAPLLSSSELAADLGGGSRDTAMMSLVSARDFPQSGTVAVDSEQILYTGKLGNDLLNLTRGANGTSRASHTAGARVVFLGGPVEPRSDPDVGRILVGGGVIETADPIEAGSGNDGSLDLDFVQSTDSTGAPLVDPQTGRGFALWRFDTDDGILTGPQGEFVLQTRASRTNPGLLDLVNLRIRRDVVLRAVGRNPFSMLVREHAEIAGTIDVSGAPGGALRFEADPANPSPGAGGEGGAGGGRGGDGGTVEFLPGEPQGPGENVHLVSGAPGELPWVLARLRAVDPNGAFGLPSVTPAAGGASQPFRNCRQSVCVQYAGGGGGGGHLRSGLRGCYLPVPVSGGCQTATDDIGGLGGGPIPFDDFRFAGELLLAGGEGGAGGGSAADVSAEYAEGAIGEPNQRFVFRGTARYAPGTGGGGGGGIAHVVARSLHLRSGARILARGGDTFQSIDLGGNGGAGSGGTIFLQVIQSLSLEPDVVFDVRGGTANRLPPTSRTSGDFLYEGNIRISARASGPSVDGSAFGGLGGSGSPGRIRIEVPAGSGIQSSGANERVTTGPFLRNGVEAVAVSHVFRLGIGSSRSAVTHALALEAARIDLNRFRRPTGTRLVVLWESARESLDVHGGVGALSGLVEDPRQLPFGEFVRFRAYFLSDGEERVSPSIDTLRLQYSMLEANCVPQF